MQVTESVRQVVEGIGESEWIDRAAVPLSRAAAQLTGRRRAVKDALSGTWLGHPLHPILTDVPIGAWTSAFMLDIFGGERSEGAADAMVAMGVVTALPTALAGMSDWSDTLGHERRVGLVHAVGNTAAVAFYALSYAARRRGDRERGVALGLLGATAATVGAYLGGHLSFRRGVGVDRNAWKEGQRDWQVVADEASLWTEGHHRPSLVRAGDDDVMLAKHDLEVHAIAATCGHAGGPLHEGHMEGGCVTCPWHGSVFRVDDGSVVHGPATGPQPAYDVRLDGGEVSVRRRPPV